MLTESFIAATSSLQAAQDEGIATTLKSNQSTASKDEGIFIHTFQPPQPGPAKQAFKKSSANAGCLAVSRTHVYAAQSGNSVVHAYKLENGVLEAVVPFPGRVRCVELALDGLVLVIGLESGGLILWETLTGRSISTPHTHLQKVTALATTEHHVLSGSADTTIHIWALEDLLSFSSQESSFSSDTQTPRHTLTHHRFAITALTTSPTQSATPTTSLALSASADGYVIAWNVFTGTALRTFLLSSPPTSLVLDPAERAAYAGLNTGDVTILDFYRTESASNPPKKASILSKNDHTEAEAPIQPMSSATWAAPNANLGPALAISLSWDAATLLTSHADGAIARWDVGRGTSAFAGTVTKLNGPATNLSFLPPDGFPEPQAPSKNLPQHIKQHSVTKPAPGAKRITAAELKLHQLSFPSTLPTPRFSALEGSQESSFTDALAAPIFGQQLLEEGIDELIALRAGEGSGVPGKTDDEDFIMLEPTGAGSKRGKAKTKSEVPELSLEQQNQLLRAQVKSLQGSLGTCMESMRKRGWGVGKMGYGVPEVEVDVEMDED